MGRRRRAERKAARKLRRAERKIKKAEKVASRGNSKRANKLKDKASKLKKQASVIKSQIDAQVITGITAVVLSKNSLGNTVIRASWNFQSSELQAFKNFKVSIAPSSLFRQGNNKGVKEDIPITSTKVDLGLAKNLNYIIKIFGVTEGGAEKFLDRTAVKKLK